MAEPFDALHDDDPSRILFGRHAALPVYLAIGERDKPFFSAGEIVSLTGLSGPAVSREMAVLKQLHLVRAKSRRGEYERIDSHFWTFVAYLDAEWSNDSTARDEKT